MQKLWTSSGVYFSFIYKTLKTTKVLYTSTLYDVSDKMETNHTSDFLPTSCKILKLTKHLNTDKIFVGGE